MPKSYYLPAFNFIKPKIRWPVQILFGPFVISIIIISIFIKWAAVPIYGKDHLWNAAHFYSGICHCKFSTHFYHRLVTKKGKRQNYVRAADFLAWRTKFLSNSATNASVKFRNHLNQTLHILVLYCNFHCAEWKSYSLIHVSVEHLLLQLQTRKVALWAFKTYLMVST